MTAYRHLRRRPMPIAGNRFRIEGAPSRVVTDFGPASPGGPFREALRAVVKGDDPSRTTLSKPRSR
jgi:hypothetical protein